MSLGRLFRGARAPEILTVSFAVLVLALLFRVQLTNLYEDFAYRIDPSAQRAFAYGERHFNAIRANEYDIDRAERFFDRAAAQDPTLPYLYHERARVSFLRGDFPTALAQINFQISLHGDSNPNAYYVRGLIEGYMGRYDDAVKDYERFIALNPSRTWASTNDYAWVLLKAGRAEEAAEVTTEGLRFFPDNPWLLNTNATALYESGDIAGALSAAKRAVAEGQKLTEREWLRAYPGNDPKVAAEGVAVFQKAAAENMHTIELAYASSTVQSR